MTVTGGQIQSAVDAAGACDQTDVSVPCSGDILIVEGDQHAVLSTTTSGNMTRVSFA